MPWHPILIHFPIALLTAAVVVDAAALLCRRPNWQPGAYTLLLAGTVGAAAAVFTGNADAAAYRQADVAAAIQDHENLGTATFLLFLLMLLGRLPDVLRAGQRGRSGPPGPAGRRAAWLWLAAGVGGLVLLYLTSHHGGELVYKHGVGTRNLRCCAP
ncbi:MAG: hypothetical protein O2782_13815 [bacterium]|nr:hypothetical protein [bacterium]